MFPDFYVPAWNIVISLSFVLNLQTRNNITDIFWNYELIKSIKCTSGIKKKKKKKDSTKESKSINLNFPKTKINIRLFLNSCSSCYILKYFRIFQILFPLKQFNLFRKSTSPRFCIFFPRFSISWNEYQNWLKYQETGREKTGKEFNFVFNFVTSI